MLCCLELGSLTLLDRGGQDLGAERKTLCPLNDLLVDRLGVVVHQDSVLLVVDLSIDLGIPDQVDNPLLALLLGHVQSLGQLGNIDLLVNPAVGLRDEAAGVLDEFLLHGDQEEVVLENLLALGELLLGEVEIKVDVESLNKLGDGVTVLVGLMLNNLDEFLEQVLATLVGDNGGSEVTENPWARSLDSVDVGRLEEEVDNSITSLGVVEEDEQGPVKEPGALLQLVKRRSKVLFCEEEICGSVKF